MRWLWLTLLVLLGGCASVQAHKARRAMIGMSAVDVQACAGIPSRIAWLDAHEVLFDYDFSDTSAALSLKFLDDISLALGGVGGCHAVFRIADSKVVEVHYTGTTAGLNGPDAACAPLVRECLHMLPHRPPPAGYDAMVLASRPQSQPVSPSPPLAIPAR